MYTMELATHTIPLSVLGLLADDGTETEGTKYGSIVYHGIDFHCNLISTTLTNLKNGI